VHRPRWNSRCAPPSSRWRSACRWASIPGLYRNSWLSRFFLTFSLIGVSLPTFLIGILLILVFSVWLGWLPSFGRGEVVQIGWWSTAS
jgi:ABC-type dipeptide/oligopeptide/nickel transport system permease component